MALYFHEPFETAADVQRVLMAGQQESQHLDFKGVFWTETKKSPSREEAAKDVAAFLNSAGGTILVGVGEDGDGRAGKLSSAHKNDRRREQLLDWLKAHLVPEAAVSAVHIAEISLVVDGAEHDVLAVNVEPWPNGTVAVKVGEDRESYRFPVRRGRETRFMSWEDIVATNDAAHRAMFLKLMALAQQPKRFVITSPMAVRSLGKSGPVFVEPTMGNGWLRDAIREDHVVLHLDCQHIADHVGRQLNLERFAGDERPTINIFGVEIDILGKVSELAAIEEGKHERPATPLAVPLVFIDAVWMDATLANTVNIALRGTVWWDGSRWSLEHRPTSTIGT